MSADGALAAHSPLYGTLIYHSSVETERVQHVCICRPGQRYHKRPSDRRYRTEVRLSTLRVISRPVSRVTSTPQSADRSKTPQRAYRRPSRLRCAPMWGLCTATRKGHALWARSGRGLAGGKRTRTPFGQRFAVEAFPCLSERPPYSKLQILPVPLKRNGLFVVWGTRG